MLDRMMMVCSRFPIAAPRHFPLRYSGRSRSGSQQFIRIFKRSASSPPHPNRLFSRHGQNPRPSMTIRKARQLRPRRPWQPIFRALTAIPTSQLSVRTEHDTPWGTNTIKLSHGERPNNRFAAASAMATGVKSTLVRCAYRYWAIKSKQSSVVPVSATSASDQFRSTSAVDS